MIDVRNPLSSRQIEGLLREQAIGIAHETAQFCLNGFGTVSAA
jgi:hypothetical protein